MVQLYGEKECTEKLLRLIAYELAPVHQIFPLDQIVATVYGDRKRIITCCIFMKINKIKNIDIIEFSKIENLKRIHKNGNELEENNIFRDYIKIHIKRGAFN